MAKKVMYKQCRMRLKQGSGCLEDVAWIPAKFAVKGKFLEVKGVNGWEVMSVNKKAMPGDVVNRQSREHQKTREASDI